MFASTSIYDSMTSSIPQDFLNMCIIAGQRFICCTPILVTGSEIARIQLGTIPKLYIVATHLKAAALMETGFFVQRSHYISLDFYVLKKPLKAGCGS